MKLPGRPLNQKDLKRLATDYIDQATAEAAALRRVNSEEAAAIVGQRDNGTYAGIVFPYRWPGEDAIREFRLRRDTPDIEPQADGSRKELRKYLSPPGVRNMLYAPPAPLELLNSTLPIVITEGEKKTLALYRLATERPIVPFVPFGLSGVANWRGKTGRTTDANGKPQQETGPIPDWQRLDLTGRTVTIVFDADTASKPAVRYQRYALSQWLLKQKARPLIVDIPLEAEAKGIDEYIAKHGPGMALALFETATPADVSAEIIAIVKAAPTTNDKDGEVYSLLANIMAPLSAIDYAQHRAAVRKHIGGRINLQDLDAIVRAKQKAFDQFRRQADPGQLVYKGQKYEATPNGLVLWQQNRYEPNTFSPVHLCNFSARIVADVMRDNGEEKTRALKLAAAVGEQSKELIITADEFALMNWPIKHLGALANLYPNYKDHVRCAIQSISTNLEVHTSYTHIGWSQDEGRPMYLHGGGAIAASGFVPNLHIELDKRTARFNLPDPPTGQDLIDAIRSSLRVLDIAPDTVTIPLLGATFRAALGSVRCSVFLSGQTGTGKSEIAALFQQFYGSAMNASALPASWDSTANALEAIAHEAKDALLVVDDFVPKGGAAEMARLHQTADRLLRAQGNASGRSRMTSEATIRAPKNPRGLVLGTGEDLPRGHSLRARMVILELQPSDLNWKVVSECQRNAKQGKHAATMAAYIQFLAGNLDAERQRVEDITEATREQLSNAAHKRTPDNIANLAAAFLSFLDFAQGPAKAITKAERAGLLKRCEAALIHIADQQEQAQESGEPCAAFFEQLEASLSSGAAHMAGEDGGPPPDAPEAYGWRRDPTDRTIWRPQGMTVGWIDDNGEIYLDPIAAHKAAQSTAQQGEALQLSVGTLKRRLHQKGHLKSIDHSRQTVTVRRTLQGKQRAVLHLHTMGGGVVEKNPTNPTFRQTFAFSDRSTAGLPENVGFQCRVSEDKTSKPDNSSGPNSFVSGANVGFVGFVSENAEVVPPLCVEPQALGKPLSGFQKTPEKPDNKTRHLPHAKRKTVKI